MKNWMVDAILETEEQQNNRKKRKENRKHKLTIELIKQYLVVGDVKKAIDIAEANNINPIEFGKISKSI